MEVVDHSRAVEVRVLLLELVDLPHGGIEAAIRFEGLPIGVIDGQLEGEDFFLGFADGPPLPRSAARWGFPCLPVDVGENRPVLLDGNRHLDVEIPDAAIGAAGVDSFRQQIGVDPELGEACDLFLLGG